MCVTLCTITSSMWSSTSIYAVLLNFETETLKHTNLRVLSSQHLKRLSVTQWMSLFVWACLSDATGEKSKWLWPEYVSRLCVADICHGHANVRNLYLFFILFCAQKSRLYKYLGQKYSWERISPLCQVQSTSIQQKSFTPFYNVIFITFDIYHKNYTATQHTHTHIETMNRTKQIQTLYIFVNQIITSQLLAALLLLSLLREKCLNKCFFNDECVKWKEQAKDLLGDSHSQLL